MSEQTVHLSRLTKRIPPTVNAVQGDTGRELVMILDDEDVDAGMVATVAYLRPDSTEYDAECTTEEELNGFRADLTQALTQAGVVWAQLSVVKSGKTVCSFRFYVDVQGNISGEITEEQYATVQDVENAAVLANRAAAAAASATENANEAAGNANEKAGEADTATQTALDAATAAAAFSGGHVHLVDMRTSTEYEMAFVVKASGDPAIVLEEVE